MTSTDEATVFIIDDDVRMRAAMQRLLKSVGLHAESFATPQEFFRRKLPDGPSCLVLDVRLPGMSGLDVQRKLIESGFQIPVIFITGHGDIPMTVKALKFGAVEFLTKTFTGSGSHRCDSASPEGGQPMQASSPAELGRMAEKLKLAAAD